MPLKPIVGGLLALAGLGDAVAQDRPITGTNRVIARHADWSVVIAETNRGKLCYAAGSPRLRRPEGAVRGRAFVFVTTRPSDRVRDEFAVEFGFEVTSGSTLTIGDETFPLSGDIRGAWIANLADETRLVAAMRDRAQMTLRSLSQLGEETVDTYALKGFAEALAQARRECADPNSTS
jgi:invasion protein IalB